VGGGFGLLLPESRGEESSKASNGDTTVTVRVERLIWILVFSHRNQSRAHGLEKAPFPQKVERGRKKKRSRFVLGEEGGVSKTITMACLVLEKKGGERSP